jgi:phosphoribosylamine--glycine ligase
MKVLVIGSGGREHALCWKLSYNPGVDAVIAAPGNGGTAQVARNVAVKDSDIQGLMALAKAEGVGLVVAGPEAPLVAGIADACAAAGIPCFGPDAFAARLEGSKASPRTVMREAGVPTAPFGVFAMSGRRGPMAGLTARRWWSRPTAWPRARAWWWPGPWTRPLKPSTT